MGGKALLNSHPKQVLGSKGARRCRVCGESDFCVVYVVFQPGLIRVSVFVLAANQQALIRKYHIDMCRQCFRERANDIGFVKVETHISACSVLLLRVLTSSFCLFCSTTKLNF
jgi:ribosomal protein S14